MDSEARKTILQILLVLTLVLVGSIGSGIFSWPIAVGGLAAACIAYFTIMCSRCQSKITTIDNFLRVRMTQVKGLQDLLTGEMTILDTDSIVAIEERVSEEIWIATYDLEYDIKDFLEVGKRNAERGVTYRYVMPHGLEPDFTELVNRLKGLGAKPPAVARFIPVYVEAGRIPFNVVLYDPQTQKHGYIYVPKQETNFFIKFDEYSFRQVRNYFYWLLGRAPERAPSVPGCAGS